MKKLNAILFLMMVLTTNYSFAQDSMDDEVSVDSTPSTSVISTDEDEDVKPVDESTLPATESSEDEDM